MAYHVSSARGWQWQHQYQRDIETRNVLAVARLIKSIRFTYLGYYHMLIASRQSTFSGFLPPPRILQLRRCLGLPGLQHSCVRHVSRSRDKMRETNGVRVSLVDLRTTGRNTLNLQSPTGHHCIISGRRWDDCSCNFLMTQTHNLFSPCELEEMTRLSW